MWASSPRCRRRLRADAARCGRNLHKCTTRPARRRTARARIAWAHAAGMGSSMYMSTTNCTSAPCTQYGHAGMRSAGTRSKDPRPAYSEGTHGARRGRMHAHGACLPCRVRPVRTLGAAAMPPPTDAARQRAGKRGCDQPARLRRPTQARRTTRRRQARQPRAAAPHPPTAHDGCTRDAAAVPPGAPETPPRFRRAANAHAILG